MNFINALKFLNPVRVIKNYFLGLILCKRYKLKFVPWRLKLEKGTHFINKSIVINPFSLNFVSIIYHEIGHAVHHKIVNYNTFFNPNENSWITTGRGVNQRDFIKILESEAFANRFALKTKKCNTTYLIKCFNTYTSVVFQLNLHCTIPSCISSYTSIIHFYTGKLVRF